MNEARLGPKLMLAGLVTVLGGAWIAWTGAAVGPHPEWKGAIVAIVGVLLALAGWSRWSRLRRMRVVHSDDA